MRNIKCLGLSVAAPWFKDLLEDTTLNQNSISPDLGRITPQNMVFVAQKRRNTASDLRNTDSSMNSSNKFKTVTHCSRVLLPCMTPFIDSQIFSIHLSYFHYKNTINFSNVCIIFPFYILFAHAKLDFFL